jgi:hypothetical protein
VNAIVALFSTCTGALSFQNLFSGRSSAVHAGLEEDDMLVEIDYMPVGAEEDASRALVRLSGVKLSTVSVAVSRLVYGHPVKGGGGAGRSEDDPAAKGGGRDAGEGSRGGEVQGESGQVVEDFVRVVVKEEFVRVVLTRDVALPHESSSSIMTRDVALPDDSSSSMRVVLTRDVALPHDYDSGGGGIGEISKEEASEDAVNDGEEENARGIVAVSTPPPRVSSSVEPTLSTSMPQEAGGATGPGGGTGGGAGGGASAEGDKEMKGGGCLVFVFLDIEMGDGGFLCTGEGLSCIGGRLSCIGICHALD